MDMNVVLMQMGKLFLILCLGIVLAKIGMIDIHTKQKLTKLLLYVTTPMMMIDAFHDRVIMVEEQPGVSDLSVGMLFAYCFLFYLILLLLSAALVFAMRVPKADKRLYLFVTVFGNVGFMGFPVVESVFGTEGLFYAAILNSVFNILVYTFGVVLMMGGQSSGQKGLRAALQAIPWKKLLLMPAVLSTAAGVLIFVCRVRLPELLADTCDTLGGLTSPLAMLVVGANLVTVHAKDVLRDIRLDIYIVLRQIALPLAMWLILHPIVQHSVLAPTLLLLCCMPVANTSALFATEYHGNEALASQSIFLSTLFSLVSLPLVFWLCLT